MCHWFAWCSNISSLSGSLAWMESQEEAESAARANMQTISIPTDLCATLWSPQTPAGRAGESRPLPEGRTRSGLRRAWACAATSTLPCVRTTPPCFQGMMDVLASVSLSAFQV